MLRKALQRLDSEDLYYVGIIIITRASARSPPAMMAARSVTLAALSSFPELLTQWLVRAHRDTNARAFRLLLSQPEYDLIGMHEFFYLEALYARLDLKPIRSLQPTMIVDNAYALEDMIDILRQLNVWRRAIDGNQYGLFRTFLHYSWDNLRNLKTVTKYWKVAMPLIALLVEYGCANALLSTMIGSFTAEPGTHPDVILRELLAWRGPNREFVDPRPYMRASTPDSAIFENKTLYDTIMQWRGPSGEYVDLSSHELFRSATDSFVFAQRFKSIQERELGREVAILVMPWNIMENAAILIQLWQAAKPLIALIIEYGYGDILLYYMINEMSLEPDSSREVILQELLAWRGTSGEFLDPRSHMRAADGESEIFRAPTLYRAIMQWRGPAGEFVDLTEPAIFRAHCEGMDISQIPALFQWRGPHNEFVDFRLSVNINWIASGYRSVGMARPLLMWQAPDGSFIHLDHIVDVIIDSPESTTGAASFLLDLDATTYALRKDTLSAHSELRIVAELMVAPQDDVDDAVWKTIEGTPFGRRRVYTVDERGNMVLLPHPGRGLALTENGGEAIIGALCKMAQVSLQDLSEVLVFVLRTVSRKRRWSMYNYVLFLRRLAQAYLWLNDTISQGFSVTNKLIKNLESRMLFIGVLQGDVAERAAYIAETDEEGGPINPDSVYGRIAAIMDLFRSATYIRANLYVPSSPVPGHLIDLANESDNPRKLFCSLVLDKCDAILAQIDRDPQERPVPLP